MIKFVIRILQKVINYLREDSEVVARTRELIEEAEKAAPTGDRRRSYVYHRLVAEFPDRTKRNLGYLIEAVLQEG